MSDIIAFSPVRALDGNGNPVAGALARFFLSGTTTPVTVYSDIAGEIPHPSPLVANGEGTFPAVYGGGQAVKVEVTTPGGVMLPGFPIDPAVIVATVAGAASKVSFEPTGDIPVSNVQAAIERVQANLVAPLLAGGIGVTGNAPILANADATNIASGFYRFTAATTGTLPAGFSGDTGIIWLLRETASNAIQFAVLNDAATVWQRQLIGGTWGAWVNPWAGLTQAQAEDDASTVFGLVSGQRLAQAVAAASQPSQSLFIAASGVDIPLAGSFLRARVELHLSAVGTSDIGLTARFTRDNFASVLSGASDYRWGRSGFIHNAQTVVAGDDADGLISLVASGTNLGMASPSPMTMLEMQVPGYSDSLIRKRIMGRETHVDPIGRTHTMLIDGILTASDNTSAINGIRITPTSGTITGRWRVFYD